MLILHTCHTYAPELNGVAEVVRQVSERLAARGHEVHVATSRVRGTSAAEVINGVSVHRFTVDGYAVDGIYGEVGAYVNFVRSQQWQIVALHFAPIWSTDALLDHLPSFAGGRVYVGHGLSIYRHPRFQTYLSKLAKALEDIDQVISLSPLLEESELCRQHGLPAPCIIPNGVDVDAWHGPPVGIRQVWNVGSRPWLLSVSNHSPVKGHATFFEVLRLARRLRPDMAGTIVGSPYPAAKWRLGRFGIRGGCWYSCRLRAFRHREQVLRAHRPRVDVIAAIREADVVAITSRREAFPVVMLESMAAGTPWVSFDVGCIRENAGGVVVGSVKEMAETIAELCNDPDRRQALGQEGRRQVIGRHNWDNVVDQYEEVYRAAYHSRTVGRRKNDPRTTAGSRCEGGL